MMRFDLPVSGITGGQSMSSTVEWPDITLRLALTIVAGLLLGLDRTERGRAAGLRTSFLVCLAASVSMIQMNLLLTTSGKSSESFAVMDVARLPLGILTGVGFIGAGAILRRGSRVRGLTTAASLWSGTVIGLCLGGGQIALGLSALALALAALGGVKSLEQRLKQDRQATLTLCLAGDGPTEEIVRADLHAEGYVVTSLSVGYQARDSSRYRTLRWQVTWRGLPTQNRMPVFLDQLARQHGVLKLRWVG
jgi:putative Mg2+ transporter-C (MgtC) family protein